MQTAEVRYSRPPDDGHKAWDGYRPAPGWYLHDAHGLHGLGHAARVLVWADLVARSLRDAGVDVDVVAVRWAAVLHDVRRLHDGRDAPHGERCGKWIEEQACEALADQSEQRRARIGYCCTWHVPPDREAPIMTPELMCLKDADALDRVRLNSPDVRLLRTPLARRLIGQAHFLFATSVARGGDPWVDAQAAAARINLWAPLPRLPTVELDARLRHFRC